MSAGFGDGNESFNYVSRQRAALADYIARETGDPYAIWYCNENKTATADMDMRIYRIASADKIYLPAHHFPKMPQSPVDARYRRDAGTQQPQALSGEHFPQFPLQSVRFGQPYAFRPKQLQPALSRSTRIPLHRLLPALQRPHNLLSYRHTRAHNTILVDGIGQPFTTRAYGKLVRMLSGENISYACGNASNAYCGLTDYPMWQKNFKNAKVEESVANGFGETPLKKYRRHILLLHPNIVVIYDELEAGKPVRWDWLLHSPVQFKFDENGKDKILTTYYPEKKFTSIARIFSNSDCKLSQTDRFFSLPTPRRCAKAGNIPINGT